MSDLFLLDENLTNGLNSTFLYFTYASSILCGIFVIVSKNPIVSVLFLIGLFLSISGYLMMLGINFIGLSYLLVYVGAVSILFLFILMLINVRISELVTDTNNSIPLAVIIGVLFNFTLYNILPYSETTLNSYIVDINRNLFAFSNVLTSNNMAYSLNEVADMSKNVNLSNELAFVSSKVWDSSLSETSHITTIGNVLYTVYPIWLIITSIILLLAMVGAIVITIKQNSN